jgi:alpha-tubulin suppressor-like RCC1 family protein
MDTVREDAKTRRRDDGRRESMRGDERLTTRARDAEQTATAMSAVRYQMSPTPNEKRRLSSMTSAREGFQGVASTERNAKRRRATGGEWEIGNLGKLPTEVLELVLLNLDVKDLARVASTCTYFNASGIVERVAGARMEFVPRATALMLTKRDSYLKAWHHCTFSERAERAAGNVSLGQFHTACVTGNESDTTGMVVSTFGRGFHGQIGDGSFETRAVPTQLNLNDKALDIGRVEGFFLDSRNDFKGVDSISLGGSHNVVLSRDGTIVTWGLASSGELGHVGTTPIEVNVPRFVTVRSAEDKITQIATGFNHTLAVDRAGRLFACGRGRSGQLGLGTFRDGAPFARIAALRGMRVVSAVAGGAHSICITSDGNVWSWGDCRYGQLGLGDLTFAAAAGWNNGVPWPCLVESLNDMDEPVASMSAGGAHSIFVTTGGRMYVCGRGKHGALGVGRSTYTGGWPHPKERKVCANRLSPEAVNIHHFVRRADGSIMENRVQKCSCGTRCRVAVAAAGATHSCVLTSCGGVFTTGENSYGQLGHGDKTSTYVFTRVEALRGKTVTTVSAGHNHTGAVVESAEKGESSLYLWGRGDWGQLGNGDLRSCTKPQEVKELSVAPPRPENEALMYKQDLDAADSDNESGSDDDSDA